MLDNNSSFVRIVQGSDPKTITATIDPRAYGYLATDTAHRNLYTISNTYDSLNRLKTITKMLNGANAATTYYYDAVDNARARLCLANGDCPPQDSRHPPQIRQMLELFCNRVEG